MPNHKKIAIFTQDVNAPSEIDLVGYCQNGGIAVDLFPLDGSVSIQSNYIVQGYKIYPLNEYALCYGRTWGKPEARQEMLTLVKTCVARGLPSVDSIRGIELNHSKSDAMKFFAEHAVSTPNFFLLSSGVALTAEEISHQLADIGVTIDDEYLVVKDDGSGGAGIYFLPMKDDTFGSLQVGLEENSLLKYGELVSDLIIQKYVPSKDELNRSFHYRVITVGSTIAAVLKFTASDTDTLASNISNGASASIPTDLELSEHDQAQIIRLASLHGLGIAGIDCVFDQKDNTLKFFEINNSPGTATAKDQCGIEEHYLQIVQYFKKFMELKLENPVECIADVHADMFPESQLSAPKLFLTKFGVLRTAAEIQKASDKKHANRSCCSMLGL